MANKNRKFVKADNPAETSDRPHTPSTKPERRQKATGKRVAAVIFWLLGLACEIFCILIINKTLYFEGDKQMYFLIGGLVADLIFVIIGSQFWKRANDVDPASESNKVKFFLWNQMGLIAAIICFFPIVLILLNNKDLDKKTKKVTSIVAACALVVASLCSIDWNPVSEEDLNNAVAEYGDTTVYWTVYGRKYHLDPDCQSIQNSATVYEGTIDQAYEAGRNAPCKFCAQQEASAQLAPQQ